jgi:O-antigen/teichoic acid export membrane protein
MHTSLIRRGLVAWAIVFAPAALMSSTHAVELPHSSDRLFGTPMLIVSLGFAALMIWTSGLSVQVRRPLWLPAVLAVYLELLALASALFAAIRPTHTRVTVAFPFVVAGSAMALTIAYTLLRGQAGRTRQHRSPKQQRSKP